MQIAVVMITDMDGNANVDAITCHNFKWQMLPILLV